MDFEQIIIGFTNFFYTFKYFSIAAIVALVVLICLKPKQMLKVGLILFAFCVVAYILYYLGGATVTGVLEKERMVHDIP